MGLPKSTTHRARNHPGSNEKMVKPNEQTSAVLFSSPTRSGPFPAGIAGRKPNLADMPDLGLCDFHGRIAEEAQEMASFSDWFEVPQYSFVPTVRESLTVLERQ